MHQRRPRPIRLIAVPYHAGRRGVGMGKGPIRLISELSLAESLQSVGHSVVLSWPDDPVEAEPEIARVVELNRRIAGLVRRALSSEEFPLVLAGNCNSCLGTCAGIRRGDLGVVWFDAHADFDTPDDNLSGFFDVMALSTLTGTCWRALRESIPGFQPIEEPRVILVGLRDLEPYQAARLGASEVRVVSGQQVAQEGLRRALMPSLDLLRSRVTDVYLHIDVDCLDTSVGRANEYAAPGGLTLHQMEEAIDAIAQLFHVCAAALTAFNPDLDVDGRMAQAVMQMVRVTADRCCQT